MPFLCGILCGGSVGRRRADIVSLFVASAVCARGAVGRRAPPTATCGEASRELQQPPLQIKQRGIGPPLRSIHAGFSLKNLPRGRSKLIIVGLIISLLPLDSSSAIRIRPGPSGAKPDSGSHGRRYYEIQITNTSFLVHTVTVDGRRASVGVPVACTPPACAPSGPWLLFAKRGRLPRRKAARREGAAADLGA